jgi:hypothetical protein
MTMSYGFIRKMSPAARREREMRKARRITALKIDEVSSCSSGAGRGVEVKLIKHERGGTPMRVSYVEKAPQTPFAKAQVAISDVIEGRIDCVEGARLERQWARETFPLAKSDGEALAKWYETPIGRGFNNLLVRRGYGEVATSNPLGNGYEDAVEKMNERDHGTPHPDVDDDPDGELAKLADDIRADPAVNGGAMTQAQAIAWAITNTARGRALARKSIERNLARQYPISP